MDSVRVFSAFGESLIPQTMEADSLAVTAADIFGPQSHLASGSSEAALQHLPDSPLSGNILYQIAVVAIFASYCIVIFRYRALIGSMLKTIWSRLHREKVLEERNRSFSRLLKLLTATGMVAVAVTGVRFVEVLDRDTALSNSTLHWVATPAAAILLCLIYYYRLFTLRTAGYLSYRADFAQRLLYLTRVIFSTGCVLFLPSMIAFAAGTARSYPTFVYLLGFEVTIWIIYLLIQTYGLFVKEKISILYWFLYLCGVEVLPVSFLFVASMRILTN